MTIRTKIVATIGPASRTPQVLRQLIEAGVNVFRLNFSHGTHEEHTAVLADIRGAEPGDGPARRRPAGPVRAEDAARADPRRRRSSAAWATSSPWSPTATSDEPAGADLHRTASCRTTSSPARRSCSPTAPWP